MDVWFLVFNVHWWDLVGEIRLAERIRISMKYLFLHVFNRKAIHAHISRGGVGL